MREKRVLVWPGGTEIGLEIHASLKHCRNIRLHAAGADVWSQARFVFNEYHIIPAVSENGWWSALKLLCSRLEVDYIFPAHDDVIVALARERDGLPMVIAPDFEVCEILRSKRLTYRHLENVIPVPKIVDTESEDWSFPVFIKPDRGQGSQGARRIDTSDALSVALRETSDPIICEYLPGEEYTVDCFSSAAAGLLFAGVRSRSAIRNGISVHSTTVDVPEARAYAERISRALSLRGVWFFQIKRAASGQLKLLEVAPRVAGTMSVHRVAGVNFPLLSILEREGIPIQVICEHGPIEISRSLSNYYHHEIEFQDVYVDLDDTLLERGQINLDLLRFLYGCVNQGKRITLITRHTGDLNATLSRHRLSVLFDEIVHIRDTTPKSSFVRHRSAIYIDDSFSERMEVRNACGVPTFDSSMIELLAQQGEDVRQRSTSRSE